MRKLLSLLLNIVLDLQQKNHEQKVARTLHSYTNGMSKTHISATETIMLNAKSNKLIEETKKTVKQIVKKNIKTPEKLIEYIQLSGTKVVKIKKADELLKFIKEEEGFITPKTGFEALYLNFVFNKKIALKSPEMFILRDLPLNIYALSHQFYKWYAYKTNLPGFDYETQEKFKNVFEYSDPNNVAKLSYQEIMGLKEAIRRDSEAIDFVLELSREQEASKASLDKIKNGETIQV